MKKLSQLGNDVCENVIVDSIWIVSDTPLPSEGKGMIIESKIFPIKGTKYSYRIDNPRGGEEKPGDWRHIHIVLTKDPSKQILAYNSNMTGHDRCHNVRIPDEVIPTIQAKGFTVPDNKIIEMVCDPLSAKMLVENSTSHLSKSDMLTISKGDLSYIFSHLAQVISDCAEFTLLVMPVAVNRLICLLNLLDNYDNAVVLYSNSCVGDITYLKRLCESSAKTSRKFRAADYDVDVSSEIYDLVLLYK